MGTMVNSLRQDFARHLRPPLARTSTLAPPGARQPPSRRWFRRRESATGLVASAPVDESAPLFRDERMSRLEAVLFLAKEPLHARKLARYANLADGTEALTLIRRLNILLDQTGRAFRVEEVAGGWQLRTRPEFANWLRRLPHTPTELRLSAPSMETLAVVAYRQPVVRAEIETVRGVACGEIIRQLMERDLVRVAGRSDELGRPYLYCTTNRFLQVFGLRSIDELPRAAEFRNTTSQLADQNQTEQHLHQVAEQDQEEAAVATTISSPTTVAVEETALRPSPQDLEPTTVTRAADDEWDDDDDEYEYEYDDEEDDDDDDDEDEWEDDDEGDTEWEEVDDDEIGDDDEEWEDDEEDGDEWDGDEDDNGEWIDVDEDEDEDEDYEYEYEDDDEEDDWD